tara:strand:- start:58 stop:1323 length:1266 start_codon:yes stop_codon:yes gene_type:complete
MVSPTIDVIHNMIVYATVYAVTESVIAALVAQIAYMLTPIIIMQNSSLTTRPLASLLFSVLLLMELQFAIHSDWVWLFPCLGVATVLFLTHRMALQALLVLSIVFSIFYGAFFYICVFVGGWVLAVVVTKGFYWRVFIGHMAMLRWWSRNIHNRYAHQIRGLPKKRENSGDAVFRIYQYVRKAPFVAILMANPFVLFAIVFLLDRLLGLSLFETLAWGKEIEFFSVWVVTLVMVGIAIRQVKQIEWAGEGERYGEYGALPAAVMVAVVLLASDNEVWFWVVLSCIAVFGGLLPALYIQWNVVAGDTDRSMTDDLRGALAWIDQQGEGKRLMTFPLSLADFALYFSTAKVLSTDSSFGHLNHYDDFFPVLQLPVRDICIKWDLDFILVNNNYVGYGELGFSDRAVAYENERFVILEAAEGSS